MTYSALFKPLASSSRFSVDFRDHCSANYYSAEKVIEIMVVYCSVDGVHNFGPNAISAQSHIEKSEQPSLTPPPPFKIVSGLMVPPLDVSSVDDFMEH